MIIQNSYCSFHSLKVKTIIYETERFLSHIKGNVSQMGLCLGNVTLPFVAGLTHFLQQCKHLKVAQHSALAIHSEIHTLIIRLTLFEFN